MQLPGTAAWLYCWVCYYVLKEAAELLSMTS